MNRGAMGADSPLSPKYARLAKHLGEQQNGKKGAKRRKSGRRSDADLRKGPRELPVITIIQDGGPKRLIGGL